MPEKEAENPLLISNFEINKRSNAVVLYINSKIFPASVVNKAAYLFKEKAWVAVDADEDEILVELKPKQSADLEMLAREFNNELLEQSAKEINVGDKSDTLLSKIKEVVSQFVKEEQGSISKQSIIAIGAILAALGLAGLISGTHQCGGEGGVSDGGDGGGSSGGESCGGGGDNCCGSGDAAEGSEGAGEGEGEGEGD